MEQDFLDQIKDRDIDLVVCSDAEAILGIGDQGVGVSERSADTLYYKYSSNPLILGHRGEMKPELNWLL